MDRPVDETRDYLSFYPEMPSGGGSFPEILSNGMSSDAVHNAVRAASPRQQRRMPEKAGRHGESTALLGFGTAGFGPGMTIVLSPPTI
jgi:hypothetical protein